MGVFLRSANAKRLVSLVQARLRPVTLDTHQRGGKPARRLRGAGTLEGSLEPLIADGTPGADGGVGGVSEAIVPHCSFRATVPQGRVFGGAEDEVVERGECHNDEIGVENAKEARTG